LKLLTIKSFNFTSIKLASMASNSTACRP